MPLDSLILFLACGVWIAWWLAYLLTLCIGRIRRSRRPSCWLTVGSRTP